MLSHACSRSLDSSTLEEDGAVHVVFWDIYKSTHLEHSYGGTFADLPAGYRTYVIWGNRKEEMHADRMFSAPVNLLYRTHSKQLNAPYAL